MVLTIRLLAVGAALFESMLNVGVRHAPVPIDFPACEAVGADLVGHPAFTSTHERRDLRQRERQCFDARRRQSTVDFHFSTFPFFT